MTDLTAIIPSISLGSVTEYVEYVETKCPETTDEEFVLFRGQRQEYEEGLVPGIARWQPRKGLVSVTEEGEYLRAIEKEIFRQFRKKSLPFLEREPETTLDWLTVAQHHNVPTRLLDWSCNALAALWFVIDGVPTKGKDGKLQHGVVYILKTSYSDYKSPSDFPEDGDFDLFSYDKFFLYEPPSITRRVFVQSGYFTFHPYSKREPHYLALDRDADYKNRLSKLIIAPECFSKIRTTLDRLGINRFSIYQSLDVLGDHLRWYYLPPTER
jgi:hypothetical protein